MGPEAWEDLFRYVKMQGEEYFQVEGTAKTITQRACKEKSRQFSLARVEGVPRGEWEWKLERRTCALAQGDFNTVHNSVGRKSH